MKELELNTNRADAETPVGRVLSLSRSMGHAFSKVCYERIRISTGVGVEGDAHSGRTVKHRSRVAKDPSQPNLRQVHLIASELLLELDAKGFTIVAGDLGENILTQGIDLIRLPRDTRLYIGEKVVLRVTGLRNPCQQIEKFSSGLLKEMIGEDEEGRPLLRTGIMTVVEKGGEVVVTDEIRVEYPEPPFKKLERV